MTKEIAHCAYCNGKMECEGIELPDEQAILSQYKQQLVEEITDRSQEHDLLAGCLDEVLSIIKGDL